MPVELHGVAREEVIAAENQLEWQRCLTLDDRQLTCELVRLARQVDARKQPNLYSSVDAGGSDRVITVHAR